MSSFMDKFKAGVADAGSKAKLMVEINKLKLHNSGKKQEMKEHYQRMGELLYQMDEEGKWPPEREPLEPLIQQIHRLKWEVEQNELQIRNLADMKTCKSCGRQVSVSDRYCSGCGHTFEIMQSPAVETIESGKLQDEKDGKKGE